MSRIGLQDEPPAPFNDVACGLALSVEDKVKRMAKGKTTLLALYLCYFH
jgi:hypothetical protein